jgi:hypothetical protein
VPRHPAESPARQRRGAGDPLGRECRSTGRIAAHREVNPQGLIPERRHSAIARASPSANPVGMRRKGTASDIRHSGRRARARRPCRGFRCGDIGGRTDRAVSDPRPHLALTGLRASTARPARVAEAALAAGAAAPPRSGERELRGGWRPLRSRARGARAPGSRRVRAGRDSARRGPIGDRARGGERRREGQLPWALQPEGQPHVCLLPHARASAARGRWSRGRRAAHRRSGMHRLLLRRSSPLRDPRRPRRHRAGRRSPSSPSPPRASTSLTPASRA